MARVNMQVFETQVQPDLVRLIGMSTSEASAAVPPQLAYVLLRGIDVLLSKGSPSFQRDHVVALLSKSLEARQPQLRQQALKELSGTRSQV